MSFTDPERVFLKDKSLGRIATASPSGEPDVAPVTFALRGNGVIEIGGIDNPKTIKWNNVQRSHRAAFVVDDLASVDPWTPRGVKVRGRAEAVTDGDTRLIRITAETIWSWGLNPDAETYFAGRIERREVNNP